MAIKITGKIEKYEQFMVHSIINWCINHFKLEGDVDINIELKKMDDYDGSCVDNDNGGYDIEINFNQSLRDVVATITHEMVHVKQYITGKWQDDGEEESDNLQYKLADQIWKENIL